MNGGDLCIFAQRYASKAISIVLGNRTLAISGAVEQNGRAIVWALVSDEMRRDYPVLLWRSALRGLRWLFEDVRVEATEAWVHKDFEVARRWIVRLGFVLSEAQPKNGFVRYVKWQGQAQQ